MSKHVFTLGWLVVLATVASQPAQVLGQQNSPAMPARGEAARKFDFESDQALANWTSTGEVTIDRTKGRGGSGGALKVGPGAKAR